MAEQVVMVNQLVWQEYQWLMLKLEQQLLEVTGVVQVAKLHLGIIH
jgi:hypothetical protein